MAADTALRTANRLRRDGRGSEALVILRDALRRGDIPPEEMERAGRFVLRELADGALPSPVRVQLLGQCTTTWLAPTIAAVAWGHDILCVVREGGYDTVLQDMSRLDNQLTESTVLMLLPWHRRLLASGDRSPSARIEDELAFWRAVWQQAAERSVARIIQVGYDWSTPGAVGYHLSAQPGGDIDTIRRLNDALRQELPPSAYFVSLDDVSGIMGRSRFYDPRRYFWTKQPFSEKGTRHLAEHLVAALRAVTIGPRKVLVVDLDDTLWGGIVGEVGAMGIAVGEAPAGEAFAAFQRYLKALTKRGVLLAACSKNNLRDAQEPFLTNASMVLSLDDFAAFEASWLPKPDALRRIAHTLGLGLDSFVFFDDNRAEQELVRQSLGEVAVVDVPDDPSEYVRVLENGLWFEAVALTDEDKARASHYAAESQRRESSVDTGSIEDYLRSLQMIGSIREVGDANMTRVIQLLAKTNQFNLTTRRHGEEQLREMLSRDGAFGLTLRLRDRFGDYGLVAVAICVPADSERDNGPTLTIDTFLMSCRVIGRTAEHLLLGELFAEARRRGYAIVRGEYVPTSRNELVSRFYDEMQFTRLTEKGTGGATSNTMYARSTADGELPMTVIRDSD